MNMFKMLQQAKALQEKLEKMQEEIRAITVVGEAGGGLVRVRLRGDQRVEQVEIADEAWEMRDVLGELIAAAFNDGLRKLNEAIQERQKAMLGGMPLPPGFGG